MQTVVNEKMDFVSIRQLSTVLKWDYRTVYNRSYRREFKGLVEERPTKRSVATENVPKFLETLYEVMGQAS